MHKVQAKHLLSNTNGINIYRGCTHGCIYCDSRSKCYQMNHQFEDVEVKENAPILLNDELKHKRKKCMIGTGSMSDPYNHFEEKLQLTRQCLKVISEHGFGLAILTKSARILRDIEIIEAINKKAKAVVQVTLTTYDEKLCKILGPHVSTTLERVKILEECKKRKIPTVVWLDPILPFINDTKDNLIGILDYCIKNKVKGIICFGFGMTLREGNYYQKLDKHFPGLKHKYIRYYGNRYEVNSPKNNELLKLFTKICIDNNIMYNPNEVFTYLRTFPNQYEQISFNL